MGIACEMQTAPLSAASAVASIVHRALDTAGQPLEELTRAQMEAPMGHDFSHVRVHTDAVAAESTQALHAEAFTVGSHVVFSAGKYAPATSEGRALLTHELTHVVQQRDAAANEATQVGTPDGEYEHEADRTAAESNGSPAGVRLRTPAQLVQRRVTASGIAKIPRQFS